MLLVFVIGHAAVYSHPASTGTSVVPIAEVTVDGADVTKTVVELNALDMASDQVLSSDHVSTQTAVPVPPSQSVTLNSDIDLQVVVRDFGLTDVSVNITGRDCRGIYEHDSCSNEVFIACPTCLRFLCHDHMDSNCQMHSRPKPSSTHSANHHDAAKFVVFKVSWWDFPFETGHSHLGDIPHC